MATKKNEDSFPVDRPESSDTESNQEGKILETHAITTTVHEMKVNHLVDGGNNLLFGDMYILPNVVPKGRR